MTNIVLEKLIKVYRSVIYNVVIDGLVSFLLPGIWYSLNYIGAAGLADPRQVNAANAVTYGIMIIGCSIAPIISNRFNLKWTLFVGAIFYAPYASALYTLNRYNNIPWLYGACALTGVGASLFWSAEAALAIATPLPHEKGRMVSIWLGLRQIGMILGGAISLGYNVNGDSTGKIGYDTYYAMIALQVLAVPAVLLLSNPRKIIRSDGSRVKTESNFTYKYEIKRIGQLLGSKHMLLLMPIFIFGQWGTVYQSNYLTSYFTVRARALASLLAGIVSLISNLLTGWILDQTRWNQRTRAITVWIVYGSIITALWVWNAIVQARFSSEGESSISLDWEGSTGRFNSAFAVYVLWKFMYESLETLLYWLMGTFEGGVNDITRSTGILRSYESVGSTFSYVVGATQWPYFNQMILSLVLWVIAIPTTCWAVWIVPTEEPPIDPIEDDSDLTNSNEKSPIDTPNETGKSTPV